MIIDVDVMWFSDEAPNKQILYQIICEPINLLLVQALWQKAAGVLNH